MGGTTKSILLIESGPMCHAQERKKEKKGSSGEIFKLLIIRAERKATG